jgi:pimeloyl-ACP methyl ester carboxylesterase
MLSTSDTDLSSTPSLSRRAFFGGTGALALAGAVATLATAAHAEIAEDVRPSPDRGDDPNFKIVKTNGVHLCVETFGKPTDPAILLIGGGSSSIYRAEAEFCRRLSDAGRFVIRYDNRDTGRSVAYTPFQPPYTLEDLADDAVGLFDAFGIEKGHAVGLSMGGMICQLLALKYPDRMLSITPWESTPDPHAVVIAVTQGEAAPGALPPPTAEVFAHFECLGEVDWNDEVSAVNALIREIEVVAAGTHPIDIDAARRLATFEFRRANNMFSHRENHAIAEGQTPYWRDRLPTITTKTLVLHSRFDNVLPLPHGEAIAAEIPGARLIVLEHSGHELPPADQWDEIVGLLIEHTA